MAPPTVLITGANRGIGLALAHLFRSRGNTYARILETTLTREHGKDGLFGERRAILAAVAQRVLPLDVRSEASIQQLAISLNGQPIDLLINNAGVLTGEPLESVTTQSLVDAFQVNAVGPLLISRALLPNLRLAKMPRIVHLTSLMGSIADNGSGGYYAYRASKAALNMLIKSWSVDVPDVPALLMHPGFVQTGMTGGRGNVTTEECVQNMYTNVLQEFLTKEGADCQWKSGAFVNTKGELLPW